MPGKNKTTENAQQQATTTNTVDPQELAMLKDNYTGAQTRAGSLTPYSGQLTAGFTPTQTQAQGVLSGIGTDPRYSATNMGAIGSVQGILNSPINGQITPQSVTARSITAPTFNGSQIGATAPVTPTPVSAGMLSGTDLSPYMNPFTKDVINSTVDQNERARQMATVSDAQRATSAGAFGGSRSGVAASLTNGEYDRNSIAAIAGLNKDNFDQAVAGATGDINRKYGADTFNSGQDLSAKTFNAGQDQAAKIYNANNTQQAGILNATNLMDAQTKNQNADINTGEFNAGGILDAQKSTFANALAKAGLTLNAAGQVVSMNNQGLATDTAQAGILSSVGDAQQAQNQQQLTDAYNAWSQGQQLTIAQQQLLNSALGLIPNQQTVNSSGTSSGTSTTTRNPGLVDIISALGGAAQGIGSMGVKIGGA